MQLSLRNKSAWSWFASGKHPIAGDFFKLGDADALLQAFTDWAESGYRNLMADSKPDGEVHAWRFWSRGAKKNLLICGIARDSCDSLGRPFPLVILGSGMLRGWESNWDLLPYALADIWSEHEYLACARLTDLNQLKDGINRTKLPSSDWLAFANQRAMIGTMNAGSIIARDPHAMAKHVQNLLDIGESIIVLNNTPGADSHMSAGYWNWALKAHLKNVPKAVFMGGIPDKSYLILFNRSLNAKDFVRLWTIASQ
ncbi:MAG: type VI secretion system-associated protein TagF [Desulfobacterales bacterium]|nr:type VI secretion system-associated protein TagF [Desulfobacterales bacterium]